MPTGQTSQLLGFIRNLSETATARSVPDRELLRRFIGQHDETAFRAIVRRHGPMVFRVCLRVLRREQDAEDAFQATFLILAKKAAAVQRQESVGSWLFGVAQRLACKLKVTLARRRARESQAAQEPYEDSLEQISVREAQELLDGELARLPEKYQAPLVLCCLEGVMRDEAAQQLGLTLRTLKSRLELGRELLRNRLRRRGMTMPGALLPMLLCDQGASAGIPAGLVISTVKAATHFAASPVVTSVVSAKVAAITEGVLKAMYLNKLQKMAVGILVLGMFGLAATGLVTHTGIVHGQGPQAKKKPVEAPAKQGNENREQSTAKPIDPLKQEVANLKMALEEYKAALQITQLRNGQLMDRFTQEQEEIAGVLTKIDVQKSTVNFTLKGTNIAVNDLPLSSGFKVLLQKKGETIDDLKVGMHVSMRFESIDEKLDQCCS